MIIVYKLKSCNYKLASREENERGAHSEKNARCGNTTEKNKRATKPKMERRMHARET